MARPITITLYVDPAAAIRAGRTTCGECALNLTDQDLARLSPTQREVLALHVEGRVGWRDRLTDHAPPIAEATIDVLAELLHRREERMAAMFGGVK